MSEASEWVMGLIVDDEVVRGLAMARKSFLAAVQAGDAEGAVAWSKVKDSLEAMAKPPEMTGSEMIRRGKGPLGIDYRGTGSRLEEYHNAMKAGLGEEYHLNVHMQRGGTIAEWHEAKADAIERWGGIGLGEGWS